MRYTGLFLVLLALLLVSGLALAQSGGDPGLSNGAIPYMSAGVGEDRSSPTPQGPDPWTVKMVFAEQKSRSYVSDVDVVITDAQGKELVNAFSDGPWFLVSLPKGIYELQATYEGATVMQHVEISNEKMKTLYFLFDVGDS